MNSLPPSIPALPSGMTGIYTITCTVTAHLYVGSSAKDIRRRWYGHLSLLRKNSHHSPHLQNAWNKYGQDCFVFQVIELVPPALCIQREQYWIDLLHPTYNMHPQAASSLGHKHSPERIEKNRRSHLGKTLPAEQRAKIGAGNRGKIVPDKVRVKISNSHKGKVQSPEHRANSAQAHKGRIVSAEERARLSVAHKGRTVSTNTRVKMGAWQKGKPKSREMRTKLSTSRLGHKDSPETRANKSAANKAWRARKKEENAG